MNTQLRPLHYALCLVSLLFAGLPPAASAQTITVSADVVGRTPTHLGYNMGENLPGSNVTGWLRYTEMNAARVWWSQDAWPSNPAPWAGKAGDLAKFEVERARLRADPVGGADWKAHEATIARAYGGVPAGTIGHAFTLSELRKLHVDVLIMMGRSTKRNAFETADGKPDWFGRWTYWRGVYLNAFYLARHYDAQRFQLFNEPDHPNSKHIEQPDYLRRLQLGSDAVQAALADVNRLYGKSLRPRLSAPVTAGMIVFGPRTGRPDTRDARTGWGELILRRRKDDFPGRSAENHSLFQVYAFQSYGRNPATVAKNLPELRRLVTTANGGAPMPILVSEMNVSTAGNFAKTTDTLDTPRYYAAFGAVAAAYVNAGIDEVYVFRLTQNENAEGVVKKNGTHRIDKRDPLKNILASTKGAESVRLFFRGFKGGRVRLAAPTVSDAQIHAAAARDETDGTHTLMAANLGAAHSVTLDLSAWKLPVNALTTVEEVSETHHGDIRSALALPPTGKLTLPLAADSVVLVTVRPAFSGISSTCLPASVKQNTARVETPVTASGRVLLALRAAESAKTSKRVRVYGGAGSVSQADLLGQTTPGSRPGEMIVDVTRYVKASVGKPLTFQVMGEDAAGSFTIGAAELRVFGRR